MSHYGSSSNVNGFRERTQSPSYTSLGKHKDDYNRFETARHAANSQLRKSADREEVRFGGFGDRAGSGVELSGFQWSGGELITSPEQLPKPLKPRTMFYSPIGDGTVAADGYELKRKPMDLSPRVTVTQLQHVERGAKGHDGVNIIEKNWSTGGSVPPSEVGYGSEYGPGSGRNSRAGGGAMSPDSFNKNPQNNSNMRNDKPSQQGIPSNVDFNTHPKPDGYDGRQNNAVPNLYGDPHSGISNLPPKDGRNSVASSVFSDPAYRLDTRTGYLITNPRELIHQFATMTPVATLDDNTNNISGVSTVQKQSLYKRTEETTEEVYAPHAPYKAAHPVPSPNKFVRQLRDETMTTTQREANNHVDPMNQRDPNYQQRVQDIRKNTVYSSGSDEIDQLTQQLLSGLQTGKSRYN